MSSYWSVIKASEYLGCTPQTIYAAINKKRIEAKKIDSHWYVDRSSLKKYPSQKYNPLLRQYGGKFLYDPSKGIYSINLLAKRIGVSYSKLYRLLQLDCLKYKYVKKNYVIFCDNPDEIKVKYFSFRPYRQKKKRMKNLKKSK